MNRAIVRHLFLSTTMLLATTAGAARSQAADSDTRNVQDMTGATIAIPAHPARIADLWFAHNEVVAMLGSASSIVATVDSPANQPWLFRVAPAMLKAKYVVATAPNAEGLLAQGVDLAFTPGSAALGTTLRGAGIPTMAMLFTNNEGLLKNIALTADALNTPLAHERAEHYRDALAATMQRLKAALGTLPDAQRPRVLHLAAISPLKADGDATIIDEWITLAGGRNVAKEINGTQKPVTAEQIAAWDPDVIILQGGGPELTEATTPPGWQQLRAVRTGHVLRNPSGAFPWDRYSSEFLLQLLWAAKALHPQLFQSIDLQAETMRFYREFFAYPLTAQEADLILASKPPP